MFMEYITIDGKENIDYQDYKEICEIVERELGDVVIRLDRLDDVELSVMAAYDKSVEDSTSN
jgi:thiamine biosynthesis protein ThiC